MDTVLKKVTAFLSKYRYAALVLLIGVILMLLPTAKPEEEAPEQPTAQEEKTDLARELSGILGKIQGVGKVEVMLTVQTGEYTVYRYDDDGTVIITDEDRAQAGLVEKVEAPVYRGAIVVCQGADSPGVRLSVIEAVSKVTGLSTDRITVLKMK